VNPPKSNVGPDLHERIAAREMEAAMPSAPPVAEAPLPRRDPRPAAKQSRKKQKPATNLVYGAPKGDVPWYKREFNIKAPVAPDEVMNFTRQASSFLRAGIPILDALGVIAEDNDNKAMVAVLADLQSSLRAGMGFGAALARHRRIFPNYYVAMVRSAELTGRLDDTLDQLSSYMARDIESRRKVKSAMTYPAVIMVMSVVAVVVLALFVLPKFKTLFTSLDAKLPLTTRMLLAVTDFMSNWSWALGLGLLVAFGLGYLRWGGKKGKPRRDSLLLRAPGLGPLLKYVCVERFCRVLAALTQAGVPLPDAVTVAASSTNNHVFQTGIGAARERMVRGEGLAKPLSDTDLFPPAANQMIRVGESTGTLDRQLVSAADFYERELEYKLKKFTDLFEPAVIIGVGLIVGFIAVALVSAMYGVFDQVKA
jgi:type IV pilus assembly protein PilC